MLETDGEELEGFHFDGGLVGVPGDRGPSHTG